MEKVEKKKSAHNTLADLNNFLFSEMERLNDEEMSDEKLTQEIERAKAINATASQVVNAGKLMLEAQQFYDEVAPNEPVKRPALLDQ
ncbi:hypothetical protein EFE01_01125 [Latilactobacillus curvatus]|nr:hypothetical protein [Latilactobacillus curvatus]